MRLRKKHAPDERDDVRARVIAKAQKLGPMIASLDDDPASWTATDDRGRHVLLDRMSSTDANMIRIHAMHEPAWNDDCADDPPGPEHRPKTKVELLAEIASPYSHMFMLMESDSFFLSWDEACEIAEAALDEVKAMRK